MAERTKPSATQLSGPGSGAHGSLPKTLRDALEWDKTRWADGSVFDNDFYGAPEESLHAAPGTLLKLERTTDTSLFTLPPATALSRFVYQSKTLGGSAIPVSAYVLWPYTPRSADDGYQLVAWCHGTSGLSPECAPSHTKNLWQHYLAPFHLALQGYVVVATDYAGLGVATTATGKAIVHEYLAAPSHANDVFYSVQAARTAFPELGKQFVVMGHSQGGGAAWGAAQRQAQEPVEGYLGAVAVSPVTSGFAEADPVRSILAAGMLAGIARRFPEFDPAAILTPEGQEKYSLLRSLGPSTAIFIDLLSNVRLFHENWLQNPWIEKYRALVSSGGRRIANPLLVIHGDADQYLNIDVATAAVRETLNRFPETQLEYIRFPGVQHDATLTGSQRIWMDWIADRFAGKPLQSKGPQPEPQLALPVAAYQQAQNFRLALTSFFYETP